MSRDSYEVEVCSECGAQLYFSRDECASFPEDVDDCPRSRKCGTFPDATATSTGPLIQIPGAQTITVHPAQPGATQRGEGEGCGKPSDSATEAVNAGARHLEGYE